MSLALAEHRSRKADCAGSIPVTGSKHLRRDRAAVACQAHNLEVDGSNPSPDPKPYTFLDAIGTNGCKATVPTFQPARPALKIGRVWRVTYQDIESKRK